MICGERVQSVEGQRRRGRAGEGVQNNRLALQTRLQVRQIDLIDNGGSHCCRQQLATEAPWSWIACDRPGTEALAEGGRRAGGWAPRWTRWGRAPCWRFGSGDAAAAATGSPKSSSLRAGLAGKHHRRGSKLGALPRQKCPSTLSALHRDAWGESETRNASRDRRALHGALVGGPVFGFLTFRPRFPRPLEYARCRYLSRPRCRQWPT